jgi:hypothetical protein
MNEPSAPLTREQKIIDALVLVIVLLLCVGICIAFWRWNAIRDARVAAERVHDAEVLHCKQACDRR